MHGSLTAEELEVVRRLPLFSALSPEELAEILTTSSVKTLPKGQILFHAGDAADSFYVMLNGWVKVFRLTPDGDESVLGLFTRGESFAEAAMLLGGRYPANAEIVEDARLLRIDSQPFHNMVRSIPEVALSMLSSMSRHLHLLVNEIEQLKTRTTTERFVDFLLRMCQAREGPAIISLPYDKTLIAQRLAMKPESLSRVLAKLRRIGVRSEQRRVIIADVARLVDFRTGMTEQGVKVRD